MLQTIHDKITGWVAYVILGAIALVFVLWGINWTFGAPTYAAKVNGSEISVNDVREAYQRQLAQAERASNGGLDDAQRNEIKQRVMQDFVGGEALLTRVQALGYRVSDADLLKAMSQIPAFQVDGKFDYARAVAVLKAQGRSVAEVEGLIRRQVQLEQLDSAMRATSFTTDAELKRLRSLTRQQREIAWLTLPAAKYAADAVPDEAALKAFYEQHKGEYLTPETVDLRYVEISLASLAAGVSVSEAQLKSFYEEQKAKNPEGYVTAERRRARHILFAVSDPKDDVAAKAKAEEILKRAQGGEDFAKLAKEFSQDPGSAQQGGDLGWSERKVWVAPFADAAFGMQPGEIRGPIKTQFGYHIIKLDGIQPATEKTFEQSKGDVEAEYRRNEAERQFNGLQDKLADAALQNGTDIEVVARKAGLPILTIDGFSRLTGGGALGNASKVIEAAFSQDVLDGHLSPIVEVEKGRGVVLHATDHKLPQQRPLEAVRAEVVAAWKKQRGIELALAAAADAAKRLGDGESWDAVAKALGGTVEPARFVSRSDASVPVEVRMSAFEAPKPQDKPIYQAVRMNDGGAAVFGLRALREEPAGDGRQSDADLKRQFAEAVASADAQSYAMAARADAKVALNPQAID
jgi:peptidyl-prolyl cis-trans isomerase D